LDQDGLWKCEALKNQMMQRIFAHDFYFDHVHKEFHRKNKGQPYVFNATKNVWTVPGCPKDFVLNFYFDVESEKWLEGEYGKVGTLEQGFPVLSHSNSLFRIPDDYWFDEVIIMSPSGNVLSKHGTFELMILFSKGLRKIPTQKNPRHAQVFLQRF